LKKNFIKDFGIIACRLSLADSTSHLNRGDVPCGLHM
jgi:hypothetical protein